MEPTGERQVKSALDPEPWRQELLHFVRRLGAGADAEDIVQETFLRWIEAPPSHQPRAWLYRVALNVLRDQRRRYKTAALALELHVPPMPAAELEPSWQAERHGIAARALAVITTLPERQQLALLLRTQRHMDYDEIATVLGCSVPTARQHFHLGVKAVRDRLEERSDE
ncbi:MAG: RNA polymerase sigma factor [Planctomycetota bacterium]